MAALAEALLAFQYQERGEDGKPTAEARLGALWKAEQDLRMRDLRTLAMAFAGVKGGGE